jgi:hypothetical protein
MLAFGYTKKHGVVRMVPITKTSSLSAMTRHRKPSIEAVISVPIAL